MSPSICEKCGKKTVIIYATDDGNVCGECNDLLNNKEKEDTASGRSDKKS